MQYRGRDLVGDPLTPQDALDVGVPVAEAGCGGFRAVLQSRNEARHEPERHQHARDGDHQRLVGARLRQLLRRLLGEKRIVRGADGEEDAPDGAEDRCRRDRRRDHRHREDPAVGASAGRLVEQRVAEERAHVGQPNEPPRGECEQHAEQPQATALAVQAQLVDVAERADQDPRAQE